MLANVPPIPARNCLLQVSCHTFAVVADIVAVFTGREVITWPELRKLQKKREFQLQQFRVHCAVYIM
jgi:hypothetical protein